MDLTLLFINFKSIFKEFFYKVNEIYNSKDLNKELLLFKVNN